MTVPTGRTDLISQYERHLIDLDRADATREIYLTTLRRMDRELAAGLARANADELRDWIDQPGRSRATRALYRTIASGLFAWATDPAEPRLDFDPTRLIKQVRRPRGVARPAPDAQLAAVLAAGERPFDAWVRLAAYAGLRCCEIAGLDRAHVDAEHVFVACGKGGGQRIIPTHPLIWEAVRQLPPGPVAVDRHGRRAAREAVSLRGNRYLRRVLGRGAPTMHQLRHWFGTHAYAAEQDLLAVQALLGHADVGTTQRYVQVAAPARARAVVGLPVLAA